MVTVYTKNTCPQCKMVKKQFAAKGVEFEEINVDEQPSYIDDLKAKGFSSLPVVEYNDFSFSGFAPGN